MSSWPDYNNLQNLQYVSLVNLGWHHVALQAIHAIHTADYDSHQLILSHNGSRGTLI
jgi:hypothetical protein